MFFPFFAPNNVLIQIEFSEMGGQTLEDLPQSTDDTNVR